MRTDKFIWRINQQIRAPQVRVLDAEGKQIGVMSTSEALEKSREAGLDLIEIAPNAKPPVAKIIELGKFKYDEEKKRRKEQLKAKASELKEIRFSPFIADNDYQTRLDRIKEFFEDKNKVRVVVVFKGRQMGSKQFGYNLFKKIIGDLGEDNIQIDMEPRFFGRHLAMVVSPVFKNRKIEEKNNAKT